MTARPKWFAHANVNCADLGASRVNCADRRRSFRLELTEWITPAPITVDLGESLGPMRALFFPDPDGNVVELLEQGLR